MCFSAPASLAAGGALAAGGIATLRIPKKKSEVPLSLFPIIFAAHQCAEGVLWLSLTGVISDGYKAAATYIFIFIAFVFWPIFVPFAMYLIETGRLRRKIILLCQIAGLYVGILYLTSIIKNPVDATVVSHSIAYTINRPDVALWTYYIAVSIPFLASSNRRLVILGVAIALSSAFAMYVSCSTTFPSVWCFFAAILSIIIYLHFRYKAKAAAKKSSMNLQHST
jgi:hypothetical protein